MKLFKALLLSALLLFPQFAEANSQLISASNASFSVPSTWNSSNNTIECWGGGAGGASNNNSSGIGGGGGGNYRKYSNVALTASGTVSVTIGAGGSGETSGANPTAGGDTWFCNATTNCASLAGTAVVAGATHGAVSTTVAGGLGGLITGGPVGATTNSAGGPGGASTSVHSGAGGGAAGSVGGVGGTGGIGTTTVGGVGGSSPGAGAGGAGGQTAVLAQPGTANAAGGGGGGGGDIAGATFGNGAAGGVPGGGGGGGSGNTGTNSGGAGGLGQCLLTWTPSGVTANANFLMFMHR